MKEFTIEEIKEKIYCIGLAEIKSYYSIFNCDSPINKSTKEVLNFDEWYKTVEVTKEVIFLPQYIIDNLSGIAIKNLFKPYLKDLYDKYLMDNEEGEQ